MRQNRIYITGILLLIFLSGKAQRIEELPAVPLQIGYEKTLHLIFPTEVKYYSIAVTMSSVRKSGTARRSYA